MTNDSMKEKNEKMNNKNKGKVFYGNDCCEVRACSHINIPKSELTEFVRLLQALGQAILVQYGSGCLGGGTTGTTGAQGPQSRTCGRYNCDTICLPNLLTTISENILGGLSTFISNRCDFDCLLNLSFNKKEHLFGRISAPSLRFFTSNLLYLNPHFV